jgi:hypothetical protein
MNTFENSQNEYYNVEKFLDSGIGTSGNNSEYLTEWLQYDK